jgi:hypothetical protein
VTGGNNNLLKLNVPAKATMGEGEVVEEKITRESRDFLAPEYISYYYINCIYL